MLTIQPISKSLKKDMGTSNELDRKSVRAELNEIIQAKKSKTELSKEVSKSSIHKKVKSKKIKKER